MVKRRPTSKRVEGPGRSRQGWEWIGGRVSPPFFICDREEPYRPEMVLWMELPSGLVVGQSVVEPEKTDGAVAGVLHMAMEQPLAGPPRRPDTIRVGDAALADEVRSVVGDSIPIAVAPTPELDELLELMIESSPGSQEDRSYLEGGLISPDTVNELFTAAQVLYRIAPWNVATDDRVLRMDIPALAVEGACVTIIGHLGQSRGVLVFPSLAGYEAFLRAAETSLPQSGRFDLGTGWLALNFERATDLPPSMRREAETFGWPVAGVDAYPWVARLEPDGASRPLVERDLEIAAACTSALSAFCVKHLSLLEIDDPEPVCESYFDDNDVEVRFTLPYDAFWQFDVEDAAPWVAPSAGRGRPAPGRNDPCHCGSGRKYKKCHLRLDEQERTAQREREGSHDLDRRLAHELTDFADRRFGSEWRRFTRDFVDASEILSLAVHWSVYHYRVQGTTVVERYLEEYGQHLPPTERAWLAAQQAAWLSIWEVTEVEPGVGMTLRDLLSHETRKVREASGSETLVSRDVVLARVVDHDGVSLLCGLHLRPLPPPEAAEVERRARGRLRRKRAVPVEKLRDEKFGRYLIRRWEEAVTTLDARQAIPPQLCNTDGDALLLTTDHFTVSPGVRSAVEKQLAALEGAVPPGAGDDSAVYVFLRSGKADKDDTVVGHARFSDTTMQLETNSRERADALRERIEAACGDRIRHRAREHTDPLSNKVPLPPPAPGPEAAEPELQQAVLDYKNRHYADWVDQSLPALKGKTPREAIRTVQGRTAVDVLLKDMENHEQRMPRGTNYDFSKIRRELGLE